METGEQAAREDLVTGTGGKGGTVGQQGAAECGT